MGYIWLKYLTNTFYSKIPTGIYATKMSVKT